VSRPSIYTPDVVRAIPRWVEAGMTPQAIAERIGTTEGSLKTRCSQFKISLRPPNGRTGRLPKEIKAALPQAVLSVVLSELGMLQLKQRAALKGMGVGAFAGLLLETIANDGLYAAVLDDEG
jgi:hypothetical protein